MKLWHYIKMWVRYFKYRFGKKREISLIELDEASMSVNAREFANNRKLK